MFKGILKIFQGETKQDLDSLIAMQTFLDGQAAYIAQSSAYSYCRARTGFMAPKLFEEPSFVHNLEISKWETYQAVLEDLLVTLEWELRPAGNPQNKKLHEALCALYDGILGSCPPPAHRTEGWPKAEDGFAKRLAESQRAEKRTADELSTHSGQVLFDTVPIHPDMKNTDHEMVLNSVRFRLLRFAEELSARLNREALTLEVGIAVPA